MEIEEALKERIRQRLEEKKRKPIGEIFERGIYQKMMVIQFLIKAQEGYTKTVGVPNSKFSDYIAENLAEMQIALDIIAEEYCIDINKAITNSFDKITPTLS